MSDSDTNSYISCDTEMSSSTILSTSYAESDDSSDESINSEMLEYVETCGKNKVIEDDTISLKKVNNCDHEMYNCNCKFVATCCNEVFSCWKCHDEYFEKKNKSSKHIIDRKNIKEVICKECGKQQLISNRCTVCKTEFAKYFCKKCNIHYMSTDVKHCDKCKACIAGYDYKHCDNCGCCMDNSIIASHKCIPDKLNNDCVICLEALQNKKSLFTMTCGHVLHFECYVDLTKTTHKCPSCSKTIKSMADEWKKLDEEIKKELIKSNKKIDIMCVDCEKKSTVPYCYSGLKCSKCGSYNTRS